MTTSIRVAQVFEKRHDDVLKSIKNLDSSDDFNRRNFAGVDYRDSKGESQPMHTMTRDGFTMLAMSYTGKRAAQFKEAYIVQFNAMEEALRSREGAARTLAEALRLAADLAEREQCRMEEGSFFIFKE